MNYSINENSVRVDIFKPSGKWQETVAIKMNYKGMIKESVKEGLKKVIKDSYKNSIAVCLEPYHEHSHPVMFVIE